MADILDCDGNLIGGKGKISTIELPKVSMTNEMIDKMIEATAEAIETEINSDNIAGLIEHSKIRFMLNFNRVAEAALKAAFKKLPNKFEGVYLERTIHLADNYLTLKEWAEK